MEGLRVINTDQFHGVCVIQKEQRQLKAEIPGCQFQGQNKVFLKPCLEKSNPNNSPGLLLDGNTNATHNYAEKTRNV